MKSRLFGRKQFLYHCIDYIFNQLWGKFISSGMHPIGQSLYFDNGREF